MKQCEKCGKRYEDNMRYCVSCGAPLKDVELPPMSPMTEKIVREIRKHKEVEKFFLHGYFEIAMKIFLAVLWFVLMFSGIGIVPLLAIIVVLEIIQWVFKKKRS